MRRKIEIAVLLAVLLLAVFPAAAQDICQPLDNDPAKLSRARAEAEIGRLARNAGGDVGMAAIHVDTGQCLSLNGQKRFPMASVYKVPIAVHLLMLVDQGDIRLDAMVNVGPEAMNPGSGIISKYFTQPGLSVSVANLFNLMMTVSDNTASDILLKLVGGPGAVNRRMGTLGIPGITLSRSTREMLSDAAGVAYRPLEMTPEAYEKQVDQLDPRTRDKARSRFNADPRDTATPVAMAALLQGIGRKAYLKNDTAGLLLETMHRCRTGGIRLKGVLPPGTPVAHKTGTMDENINDVGLITLPGQAGQVAIAVLIKSAKKEGDERQRAIAEIARTVYDYFLFNSNHTTR